MDEYKKTTIARDAENATYKLNLNLPNAPKDEPVYPTGIKMVVIVLAICVASFLVALDQTIIATAIPRITDEFNSVADIGWYGSVSSSSSAKHFWKSEPLNRGPGLFLDNHFTSANVREDLQDIQRMVFHPFLIHKRGTHFK
jgi:hypothetical protein